MFYNIMLTQRFNVVKHFHLTFQKILENILCLLGYRLFSPYFSCTCNTFEMMITKSIDTAVWPNFLLLLTYP